MILTNRRSLGTIPLWIVGGFISFSILLTLSTMFIVSKSEPVAFITEVNQKILVDTGNPSDEYANAIILDFADKYWTWFSGNRRFRIKASMINMAPDLAAFTSRKMAQLDNLADATYLTSLGDVRQIVTSRTSPTTWSSLLVMEILTTFGGINDGSKSTFSAYRFTLHSNKPTVENPYVVVIDSMQQVQLPDGFSSNSARNLGRPETTTADYRSMDPIPLPDRQMPFTDIGEARENPKLLKVPK